MNYTNYQPTNGGVFNFPFYKRHCLEDNLCRSCPSWFGWLPTPPPTALVPADIHSLIPSINVKENELVRLPPGNTNNTEVASQSQTISCVGDDALLKIVAEIKNMAIPNVASDRKEIKENKDIQTTGATEIEHQKYFTVDEEVAESICDSVTYGWLPLTPTLANSNLTLTRTKVDFPWISFIHLL